MASPISSTEKSAVYSVSETKLNRNKQIAETLLKSGFDVYLPQENQKENGKETLQGQLEVIKNCDFLIAILSDTRGTYLEAGYAKALGKKVYAIKVEETRPYSDWLTAFFDYVADDTKSLVRFLKNG